MRKTIFLFLLLIASVVLNAAPWYDTALPGIQVMDMKIYKSQLWVASYGKGIFQYDMKTKTWKNYCTANQTAEDDFFHCIAVSDDYIWAGTSEGLYIYDRKKELWKKRKFVAGGEYGNWIRALYYDQDENVLWIGRFQYLSRLDVRKQKFDDINMTVGTDDRTNNIKALSPDGKAGIWIGTESGAFRFDKKLNPLDKSSYEYFNNREGSFRGLGDFVSVASIYANAESVWFATEEFITVDKPHFNLGGLFLYDRKATWTKYDRLSGLGGNGVKAVVQTGNRLWLGVYAFEKENKNEIGQGLAILNLSTGTIQNIRLDDIKAESNLIHSLLFDGDVLWIGSDKGLYRIYFTNPFAVFSAKKKSSK
jgi:ligand-binding sensor domain-containing protein